MDPDIGDGSQAAHVFSAKQNHVRPFIFSQMTGIIAEDGTIAIIAAGER
jgi:hypothetical protein